MLHGRKHSASGLSPINRPIETFATPSLLSTSPPSQPLGPAQASASLNGSATVVKQQTTNAQPTTQTSSTQNKTPDLTAQHQHASIENSSYYSSHGMLQLSMCKRFFFHILFCEVILSTYPGQAGIKPVPLKWYAQDPKERGPVIASRHPKRYARRFCKAKV